MSFSENLKQFMRNKKITADEIAGKIGVTRGTVTHWSNGLRFPKDDLTIQSIASVLSISVGELFGEHKLETATDGLSYLPLVNVYAGAGAEGFLPDIITEERIPIWTKLLNGVNPKNLTIFQVVGDSMDTTIRPDDWVIIDMVNGRDFHHVDGIYLINKDGSIQIKRLQFKGAKGVDIISDNKEYPMENTVTDHIDMFVIGKLYRHVRTLGALAEK